MTAWFYLPRVISPLTIAAAIALVFSALLTPSASAITFEDVTDSMISLPPGATAGSAWGDANSDEWPDLWISNHHGRTPNLLINQNGNGFKDNASALSVYGSYLGDSWPDYHGAAWADFDNDGDQDLVVLTGGGAGRGASANHLFVNHEGRWSENAEPLGLAYPNGRGRTPLWLDVNLDGRLDLLTMNKDRKTAPSQVFVQSEAGFFDNHMPLVNPESWWLSLTSFFSELLGLQDKPMMSAIEFPLMTSQTTVATFDRSTQIRQTRQNSLEAIEVEFEPATQSIQDAVAGDFNGDQQPDLYVVRSKTFVRNISRDASGKLHATLNGSPSRPAAIRIQLNEDISLGMYRPWRDPSDPLVNAPLQVISGKTHLALTKTQRRFTREESTSAPAEDKSNPTPAELPSDEVLRVTFDPATESWLIENTSGALNLTVTSKTPAREYSAVGFKTSIGDLPDVLFLGNDSGYTQAETGLNSTACQSVVAADFDNDADLDLYLTCSEPTRDVPDLYLENSGTGTFSIHEQPTATAGRGNQVTTADFNNDGFIDLAVTNGAGAPPWASEGKLALLRNSGNGNGWLEITLTGTQSNRDGIGAEVTLVANGKQQTRLQDNGIHSFSQNHSRLHFGLGQANKVDRLTVRWPSGREQTLTDVTANQRIEIIEATPEDAS